MAAKDTQLALQKISKQQKKWLVKESRKTGEPITFIIRQLIQEKVDAS